MKIKDLISKLEELSQQSELGLDANIFLVENWHALGAVNQITRDLETTDLVFGKVTNYPIMRNESSNIEGVIIGYLNTVE